MDDIERTLRQIMIEQLAIDPSNIGRDELLSDAGIDSDDISFLFIPEAEKQFNVHFSVKQWGSVGSIREIADLIRTSQEKSKSTE